MPIEFVGMVWPREWSETKGPMPTGFDLDYMRFHAHAHERAGFDRVLIAGSAGTPDTLQIAAFLAANTERLGYMIAHRPAINAPTAAARAFATLDQTSRGRIRLHTTTGMNAEFEEGDTLTDKVARYERADEYLQIVRQTWTSETPFDFDGKYFKIKNAFSTVKPYQKPHVPISVGGASDAAYRVAVRHADLYAIYGEPLADAALRIAQLRRTAAEYGVPAPRVSVSVRLILGATEELAWERAHKILADIKQNPFFGPDGRFARLPKAAGSARLLEAAGRADRHDRALWMPTASAVGAYGDTSALVGTPETVVAALLDYVDLGVTTFLNRGYDPIYDTIDYGRWIIPAVQEEVRRRDQAAKQVA
jgi:alkanesulfonate monooxygenase